MSLSSSRTTANIRSITTQVYTSAIIRVYKFYFTTTASYSWYLRSPFLRDHRLIASFIFLQYFYKEGAIQFSYSSLLIRLSSIELIGHILASKESIFSSDYIQELRYSSYNSVQVYNKIFIAIQLSRSYLYLIRAPARFIAPTRP